jgi:MFS family permease
MSKSAWRRRRIGLVVGLAAGLVLGLTIGTVLSLAVLGLMHSSLMVILGAVIVVALILVVPSGMLLVRANQELQQSGELDLKAMREKNAARSRKSSNRVLFVLPAYAVFLLLMDLGLSWVGGGALPWGLVALIMGLLALQFILELAKRKLRAKRDAASDR